MTKFSLSKISGSSLLSLVTPEELDQKCSIVDGLSFNIASKLSKQGGFLEGAIPVVFRLLSKYALYPDVRVCIRVLHSDFSIPILIPTSFHEYGRIIIYFFRTIIKENIRHVTKRNWDYHLSCDYDLTEGIQRRLGRSRHC